MHGGGEKERNSGTRIPGINPFFFFFLPHIQELSSLPDSPSPQPASPPSPTCLQAVFTLITPPSILEKSSVFAFSLWLPTPCASWKFHLLFSLALFLSCPLSLLASRHICIHGWIQLPRWGMMMRKCEATSRDLPCWAVHGSARGWMKTVCMEEDWSCLHINAT